MRRILFKSVVFLILTVPVVAQSTVEVGQPAPDFELRDATGQVHELSDYRGERAVVLEFFRSGDW